ncbi:hypothetical protein GH733_019536 [Mirounga leonina]|nr:hypothetical protein GH733_019536 [Mirounga leonina]
MAVQVVQAVQAVHLESDAFLVCLNHALSTEKEEVMGLCIGEVSRSVSLTGTLLSSRSVCPGWVLAAPTAAEATGTSDLDPWADPLEGQLNDDTRSDSKFTYTGTEIRTVAEKVDTVRIVHIHSVIILRRSDKRKDRVEISPEQLSAASTEAEISLLVNKKLLYVRTQAMYQMMDQGFVGLIFSCFIEDKNTKTGRVLYTCFQSIQAQKSSDVYQESVQSNVSSQRASPTVAGGQTGAKPTASAGVATRKGRAYARTFFSRIKSENSEIIVFHIAM